MPGMTSRKERLANLLFREQQLREEGFLRVAGVDEAGRGPLAGPVVAAAACECNGTSSAHQNFAWFEEIFDSKALTETKREQLFELISGADSPFHIGIGIVDHKEIDKSNILKATHKAMRIAVEQLIFPPDYVLVDGTEIPGLNIPHEKVVKGDKKCFCIAAASIVAKVTRDRMMVKYAEQFPEYNFEKHKGYGTKEHIDSIRRHGRCPVHRHSFKVAGLDAKKKKSSHR